MAIGDPDPTKFFLLDRPYRTTPCSRPFVQTQMYFCHDTIMRSESSSIGLIEQIPPLPLTHFIKSALDLYA